jgi:hypothetical protein
MPMRLRVSYLRFSSDHGRFLQFKDMRTAHAWVVYVFSTSNTPTIGLYYLLPALYFYGALARSERTQ